MELDYEKNVMAAIQDIEDYYCSSFKLSPERCMPFVLSLIEKIEKINMGMTPNQVKKMQEHLEKSFQAMQTKDYVVLRDYLYYEIRALLIGLKVSNVQKGLKN